MQQSRLVWTLAVCLLAIPGAAAPLPKGFVYLRDIDPRIVQDIRYAGAHNFLGRPADGYGAAECVLAEPAAIALQQAQKKLAAENLSLIVWDCYRPARAVRDFLRWTQNPDQTTKAEFFPHIDKTQLVPLGYIAARSKHSLGGTVDVGITFAGAALESRAQKSASCIPPMGEKVDDGTIDFGSSYDCFDPIANLGDARVAKPAANNRQRLRELMASVGFKPYDMEWWHFELREAPFASEFDFEIRPR